MPNYTRGRYWPSREEIRNQQRTQRQTWLNSLAKKNAARK